MLAVRRQLACAHLRGQGIEIGALHCPLEVPPEATVRYVDRLPEPELRKQYPKLTAERFCVDIVDDGEKLLTFAEQSLDFIIGNHFLEHCENPLGTIRSHLGRLRPGGILYYAIPDKHLSFDRGREITSWQHLVDDDRLGPQHTREAHYLEFVRKVKTELTDEQARDKALRSMAKNYSIHFHVWDQPTFADFLTRAQAYLNHSFTRIHFQRNGNEFIAILQRTATTAR